MRKAPRHIRVSILSEIGALPPSKEKAGGNHPPKTVSQIGDAAGASLVRVDFNGPALLN